MPEQDSNLNCAVRGFEFIVSIGMNGSDKEDATDMNVIDDHLRVLQSRLTDLKGELSYIAEGKDEQNRDPEAPTKFSDEGEPTIPGILHMVNKANIHANHCLTLIHKIRGNAPPDGVPTRG